MLRMLSIPEGVPDIDTQGRVYLTVTQGADQGKRLALSELIKGLVGHRAKLAVKFDDEPIGEVA